MLTITPATPPMKPASPATCITSMELTAFRAVEFLRCGLVALGAAMNFWLTVGLLQTGGPRKTPIRCRQLQRSGPSEGWGGLPSQLRRTLGY